MNNSLHQAILDGFKKAGWLSPSEDVVRQIEYSVNQMEGRAGNEGEKAERLDAAAAEIGAMFVGRTSISAELIHRVRDIIAIAQG
jgi:hypothetical protein